MTKIRGMMPRRTTVLGLCLGILFAFTGCTATDDESEASTKAVAPSAVNNSSSAIFPHTFEGETGRTVCIETLASLTCPILERGSKDAHTLSCEDGVPSRLRGNLSWDDSSHPSPQFKVSLAHKGESGWRNEVGDQWVSTRSPMFMDMDLTRYAGHEIALYITAAKLLNPSETGLRYSFGEDFQFAGSLSCWSGFLEPTSGAYG